ncbi:hypothetical protein ACLBW8_06080 [Pseudomonas sp. M5A4_2d]
MLSNRSIWAADTRFLEGLNAFREFRVSHFQLLFSLHPVVSAVIQTLESKATRRSHKVERFARFSRRQGNFALRVCRRHSLQPFTLLHPLIGAFNYRRNGHA